MRPAAPHMDERSPYAHRRITGLTWVAIAFLAAAAVAWMAIGRTYNELVRLDQRVQSQWAQVENTYQRRADLVPNLVETVKGARGFEQETFTKVAEARARVGQLSPELVKKAATDPAAFEEFQKAQDALSSSMSRLLVTMERYPDLKATEAFRDLSAQLEGTENRIAVERMRFNEAARDFNSRRSSFPTVLVAGAFGARFQEKAYFKAQPGAESVPRVKF